MTASDIISVVTNLIGTIAVICLVSFIVEGTKSLGKIRGDYNHIRNAIFLGIIGGCFGIYATLSGSAMSNGALVSIRDVGPMFAGCLGGPIGGLIAGTIAGVFRLLWGLPDVTVGTSIPCAISTFLVGVVCGFIYKYYKKARHKPLWACLIGFCSEVFHLTLVFFYVWFMKDVATSWALVSQIAIPFLLSNALGFGILQFTIQRVRKFKKSEDHEKSISTELNVATKIQEDMLPVIFPDFPGRTEFDLYGKMTPAKQVGGDFYDFFFVDDDHFAFLIGDVSGKGVPAALFMVISKTILKNNTQNHLSPSEVLTKSNKELCYGNEQGMFVTVWLGIYEISSGRLQYANAGHNPPIIKRGDGRFEFLKNISGFILAGNENMKYKDFETYLHDGDKLLLYTDGVTEAMNEEGKQYTEQNLMEFVTDANSDCSPKDIVDAIDSSVAEFRGKAEQSDDITMLALKVSGVYDEISLPVTIDNFDEFADFMNKKLTAASVPSSIVNKLNVVLDELFSNVVNYSKSENCLLGVSVVGHRISLKLDYKGVLFDVTKAVEPDISLNAQERNIGGLGLMIVKKSVDSLTYNVENKDTNVITIYKKF